MKRKSNLRFFIAFPLASAIAALLAMSPRLHAAPYTWTQNTAATQTWTTPGNWVSSTEFVSAPGNELIFFANTTAALASGINDITGSVPGSLSMNTLTLNGRGNAAGIDKVEVKIRRTLAVGSKLFTRLNVVVTP